MIILQILLLVRLSHSCKFLKRFKFILDRFRKQSENAFFYIFLYGFFFCALTSHAEELPFFEKIAPGDFPQFEDDLNFDRLAESIQGSIDYFDKLSPLTTISFGEDRYSTRHLARSLRHFKAFIQTHPTNAQMQEYILQNYYVYTYVTPERRFSFSLPSCTGEGQSGGEKMDKSDMLPPHPNPRITSRAGSLPPGERENSTRHDTVKTRPSEVLFTGYYEPMLNGSRTQTNQFNYPIYGRPSDLVTLDLAAFSDNCPMEQAIGRYAGETVVPYYSRKEIMELNVLQGKALTIAWVDDPVDLFFLHIQGSGKIRLNSEILNVHYLISNGHPYQSIGKYLIEKGRLTKEEVSMQTIRSYLKTHPEEMDETFNYNPRYVFFEEVDAGPVGCFNIALTSGRSIALDKKQYPPATMAFIKTQKPMVADNGAIEKWVEFSRFVMNQDTGSAIVGPARADIFWGHDEYAELAAGYMKQPGRLYFLVLKPLNIRITPPVSASPPLIINSFCTPMMSKK
jgi:membrane-bound lytic murein transglycosylase A